MIPAIQRASHALATPAHLHELRPFAERGDVLQPECFLDLACFHMRYNPNAWAVETALRNVLVFPDAFHRDTPDEHLWEFRNRLHSALGQRRSYFQPFLNALYTVDWIFLFEGPMIHDYPHGFELLKHWHVLGEFRIAKRILESMTRERPIPQGVLRMVARWAFQASVVYEPQSSILLASFWKAVPDAVDPSLLLHVYGRILKSQASGGEFPSEAHFQLLCALNPPVTSLLLSALEKLATTLDVHTPDFVRCLTRMPLGRLAERPQLVEILLQAFEVGILAPGFLEGFAKIPAGRKALLRAGAESRLLLSNDAFFDYDPRAHHECIEVVAALLQIP